MTTYLHRLIHICLGTYYHLDSHTEMVRDNYLPSLRDQRGLSQSTENAILLTGAVAIAIVVIAIVKGFVEGKLHELT